MVAHLHGMEGVESSNLFRSTFRSSGIEVVAGPNPVESTLSVLSICLLAANNLFYFGQVLTIAFE